MVDLTHRKVVIFGAGKVAERKAFHLNSYTSVLIVNSEFSSKLTNDKNITLLHHNISQLSDDQIITIIKTAYLIIPATKSTGLNQRITALAKECSILVNDVDTVGEVIIPSVVTQGDLLVGISTQGASPALSKYTRLQIEKLLTVEYAEMARLQSDIRKVLKEKVKEQSSRKKIIWEILNNESIWEALTNSYEQAYQLASKQISNYIKMDKNIID